MVSNKYFYLPLRAPPTGLPRAVSVSVLPPRTCEGEGWAATPEPSPAPAGPPPGFLLPSAPAGGGGGRGGGRDRGRGPVRRAGPAPLRGLVDQVEDEGVAVPEGAWRLQGRGFRGAGRGGGRGRGPLGMGEWAGSREPDPARRVRAGWRPAGAGVAGRGSPEGGGPRGGRGSLPGHAVVGGSQAKGGAEGVGPRGAGAPSRGHSHGLVVHHTAVLAALGEEGRDSEGLRWARASDSGNGASAQPLPRRQGRRRGWKPGTQTDREGGTRRADRQTDRVGRALGAPRVWSRGWEEAAIGEGGWGGGRRGEQVPFRPPPTCSRGSELSHVSLRPKPELNPADRGRAGERAEAVALGLLPGPHTPTPGSYR